MLLLQYFKRSNFLKNERIYGRCICGKRYYTKVYLKWLGLTNSNTKQLYL